VRRTIAIGTCALMLLAGASPSPADISEAPVPMVVHLDRDATPAERAAARSAAGAVRTGSIPRLSLERWLVPAGTVPRVAGVVEWAEPDRTLYVFDSPNDPLLPQQWAYKALRLERAWKLERGVGAPVVVGVIDTGIDATHPEMEGRLVPGRDFVDNDDMPEDVYGHGTGVAAIALANTDNRHGIAGMSWGAKAMPLKTCNEDGACSMFAVAQAIVAASVAEARVVNLSLGGAMPSCPRTLGTAATFAEARGSLLIAASGNSAQQGNPTNYPAACDGFLAVGATNVLDDWASFSDYGDHVDVSAPGASITTAWLPEKTPRATRGYITSDGTSFAAPHVAGLAALLWSQHPDWTPAQVETRILETAADLGPEGRDPWFGHGRIDVVKALSR
jgi:thermitase